jgi:hypothetical protein
MDRDVKLMSLLLCLRWLFLLVLFILMMVAYASPRLESMSS